MSKMTNEQKQLLLVDLCARLPYKVKAQYFNPDDERLKVDIIDGIECTNPSVEILISEYGLWIEEVKPYLRPMLSMTEEEKKEYSELLDNTQVSVCYVPDEEPMVELIDWLNEHHFDYRELIEKGLALEAPEGMYN